MSLHRVPEIAGADENESEISRAAIAGYARLRRAVEGPITSHAFGDGGLICERRRGRARSTFWYVSADGTVIPDAPYSYAQRAFVASAPVSGLAAVPPDAAVAPEDVASAPAPRRRPHQRGV